MKRGRATRAGRGRLPRRRLLLGGLGATAGLLAAPSRPGQGSLADAESMLSAGQTVELRSPLLTVRVRLQPFRLSVLDAQGQILQTQEPPSTASAADWQAWSFAVGGDTSGVGGTWHALAAATVDDHNAAARTLRLRVAGDDPAGRAATVAVDLSDPAVARVTVQLAVPAGVSHVALQFAVPSDEHYFGFGSHSDRVDFRGALVENVLVDRVEAAGGAPIGDPDRHGTYAATPFWLTNRGYGVLLTTAAPTTCDLAAAVPDRARIVARGRTLDYRLLAGPKPLDVLTRFSNLVGRPPLPPPWTFGVWKTSLGGAEAVLAEAERLRSMRIPVSALFCYDIVDGEANLGWPERMYAGTQDGAYGDVAALSRSLHARGFRVMGYLNCFVQPGTPPWQEAVAGGFLLSAPDGTTLLEPLTQRGILDVTNGQAIAWWQGLLRRILLDLDLDGWMQDFGDTTPETAVYADGSDPLEMRNRYPVLYARAAHEEAARRKPDFVFFMRSSWSGAQPYQRAVWPGDQVDSWDAQWGFPAAVRAGINEGIAGTPFWGSDVGGYRQGQETAASERELWLRWTQFGAFSPVMRDLLGQKPAGRPVDLWTDEETVAIFRRYATLHVALFPYFYSMARAAHETGAPMMRHLALAYPDDPTVYGIDDAYMLGDAFLVAPVVKPGLADRPVYLPDGAWVDYWDRALLPGGRWLQRATPLDLIPVYVRAGALVPTLPAAAQTLAPATDPGVTSASAELPELDVEVFPYPLAASAWASGFTLHDGTALTFQAKRLAGNVSVAGGRAGRLYRFTLPASVAPRRVTLQGQAVPRLADVSAGGNAVQGRGYQSGLGLVVVLRAGRSGALAVDWE